MRGSLRCVFCGMVCVSLTAVADGNKTATTVSSQIVHVAVTGDDHNPGTEAEPVARLQKAYELVKNSETPTEIIIHAGVYEGGVALGRREDRFGDSQHILIRAATKPDGSFEKVAFDGAKHISEATPAPGAPGVFQIPGKYQADRPPQMWEADSRKRYTLVADKTAVAHYPASFWFDDEDVFFHTSDDKPPEEHDLGISRHSNGISLWRSNITLRGLEFHSFLTWNYSHGAGLFGAKTAVEDCYTWNAVRGFYAWMDTPKGRIIRCRAEDVGTGIFSQGLGTIIEDCRLDKVRDDFLVPVYSQDDTGIHYYYPAKDGEIRRNLITGHWWAGIFVKCPSHKFIVENNTVLGYQWGGIGGTSYDPEGVYRFNICVGRGSPFVFADGLKPGTVMDYNLGWGFANQFAPRNYQTSFEKTGTGQHTLFAEPRFVSSPTGDYRLLLDSPCVKKGPNGETFGALPVLESETASRAPAQPTIALAEPAKAVEPPKLWSQGDPWLAGGIGPALHLQPYDGPAEWLAPSREVQLSVAVSDGTPQPKVMQIRPGNGKWSSSRPFEPDPAISLPVGQSAVAVQLRVGCAEGNWSPPAGMIVRVADGGPQLTGEPIVHTNRDGAVFVFETDLPCAAALEFGLTSRYGSTVPLPKQAQRVWTEQLTGDWFTRATSIRTSSALAVLVPQVESGKTYHYRLVLTDALGGKTVTPDGTFSVAGEPTRYYISPEGVDAEGNGTKNEPWRSLQFAADRALPGDRIALLPGFYPGQASLTHGGLSGTPITIEADQPGTVVMDGRHAVDSCLRLDGSPHVSIKGLEVRWFQSAGIYALKSPDLTIAHCRLWNRMARGWVNGTGIVVRNSPGFVAEDNVLYCVETGMVLYESPNSRIVHNTGLWNMYGAAYFLRSVAGSVCQNNCFAFSGNQMYRITTADEKELETFDADYNNLGTRLREWQGPRPAHSLMPEVKSLQVGSKTMVTLDETWYHSLEEWRDRSGRDMHSIFADPQFVDPDKHDFRLRPDSPNIGAGKNGATIGARWQ
ncbi:MAG: right-handed parallel beta-helix repeat-containing protein [Planctomycetes bacterium]|nr:right-handed parallel beta-helix repeat-containing protein [Planctomycetota bacterium]MBL7040082.1 right-handed parallel beta-helix repeat-containing protein [Pirellulaceae bacterium]